MESICPKDIIVIDESGTDLSMTSDYARAEEGKRAVAPRPHSRGYKFSIIGAMSVTGIVAAMYLALAVNTEIFLALIVGMLLPNFILAHSFQERLAINVKQFFPSVVRLCAQCCAFHFPAEKYRIRSGFYAREFPAIKHLVLCVVMLANISSETTNCLSNRRYFSTIFLGY